MVRVKICGITNVDYALMAVEAGADALGFVFYSKSPRCVTPEKAAEIIRELPPFVQAVGLFVNESAERVNGISKACRLDIVQLHGEETPAYCELMERRVVKVFRVKDGASITTMQQYRVAGYLLDAWSSAAYGGTGQTFDWELAREAGQHGPLILAGGLTPENVAEAVSRVQPYAVDVSSGVEAVPGKKDPAKVREFIRRAKEASP
ncbi:MAG: phosphoribosylanthranilate isomerase [Geobacter sp.]|nr:MAG: phosphoribosylanthranilate isomerase [Geobacter sp.]